MASLALLLNYLMPENGNVPLLATAGFMAGVALLLGSCPVFPAAGGMIGKVTRGASRVICLLLMYKFIWIPLNHCFELLAEVAVLGYLPWSYVFSFGFLAAALRNSGFSGHHHLKMVLKSGADQHTPKKQRIQPVRRCRSTKSTRSGERY